MCLEIYRKGVKSGIKEFKLTENRNNCFKKPTSYIEEMDIERIKMNNTLTEEEYINGWSLERHSKEILLRLMPESIPSTSFSDYKLLMSIKKTFVNKEGMNVYWIKGAVLNKKTNEIMFRSSVNNMEHLLNSDWKHENSHDAEWFLTRSGMIAPLFFYEELKNRLTI
jgi:hypothetical protein